MLPLLALGRLAQTLYVGIHTIAQLLLNHAHLLLQVVVLLALVELLFYAILYVVLKLGQLLLAYQYLEQTA